MKQPEWNMYEAALLLEAVLNVEAGHEKKRDAIKRISSSLRAIALKRGLSVDDIYRNINGITMQFQCMEYSAFGRKGTLNKTGSKLFDEVVALRKNSETDYKQLLAAAYALECGSKTEISRINSDMGINENLGSKNAFLEWLIAEGKKEESAKWIIEQFERISKYALKRKIVSCALLDTNDVKAFNKAVNAIQSFKLFRISEKNLFKFLQTNSKLYTSYLTIQNSDKETCTTAVTDKNDFLVTDNDRKLFEEYGNKVYEIYLTLKTNDKHVYLTKEQICSTVSIDTQSATEVLEKSSWAEKLGDGYILGNNSSLQQDTIEFSISEAFSASSRVEIILQENFRRGFRPTSIMDRNRFVTLYEEKYGETVSIDNVIDEVQKICFSFDDRFFLPKALISKNTAQEIACYLSEYFIQKEILFYNVLFDAFEEKCESYIYSADMLIAFLQATLMGTKVYYSNRYCSLSAKAVPDISSEVIDYLVQADAPCSYDDIYGQLSHLDKNDIYKVLHYNNPEILGNSKVEYFHVITAHLTNNELEELNNIASTLLSSSNFITCNEIMDSLNQSDHSLMERLNGKFSTLGIRRIFTYYLRNNFDVDTGIVSNKGMKMTVIDAFKDFAINHKSFNVDDVQNFSEYTGTAPYWDTIHRIAVRINETEFVSDDDIDFDVNATDNAIEYYCMDYIPLSDITDFSRFPSCGFTWNSYLLQQYVFRFSEKFKLLSLGFTKSNVSGAIVRKQSGYDDFDSIVIDALEKTKITTPNDAIQYLCDKGLVAEKRYKKHVELLKVAIAHRNKN